MPNYMLLLYRREGSGRAAPDAVAERRLLAEAVERLSAAGILVSADALHETHTATTVAVRGGRGEVRAGAVATGEQALYGCLAVDCRDLDEVVAEAMELPTARYGAVEIRPIVDPREHWEHIALDGLGRG